MTGEELRKCQEELGMSGEEMAEQLGMAARSYYYRLAGELPIKPLEAKTINQMVAAHRMATDKRNES